MTWDVNFGGPTFDMGEYIFEEWLEAVPCSYCGGAVHIILMKDIKDMTGMNAAAVYRVAHDPEGCEIEEFASGGVLRTGWDASHEDIALGGEYLSGIHPEHDIEGLPDEVCMPCSKCWRFIVFETTMAFVIQGPGEGAWLLCHFCAESLGLRKPDDKELGIGT